ncbi:Uncharacterized protein QTN25_007506 [Entamoeba marina]
MAGLKINAEKNSSNVIYLKATLSPWDTIRIEKSAVVNTSGYSFISYVVSFEDDDIPKMLFRIRVFSSEYNQQTETELKSNDCRVKSGIETRVYVPLTVEEEKDKLQTFSIQRMETTSKQTNIKITKIELVPEGIATPLNDVEDVGDGCVGIISVMALVLIAMLI